MRVYSGPLVRWIIQRGRQQVEVSPAEPRGSGCPIAEAQLTPFCRPRTASRRVPQDIQGSFLHFSFNRGALVKITCGMRTRTVDTTVDIG